MTRDVLVDVGGVKGGDRIHRGHVRDRSDQVRINGGERGKGRVSVHRDGDPEVEADELAVRSGDKLAVLLRVHTAAEGLGCRSQQLQAFHKQAPAEIQQLS